MAGWKRRWKFVAVYLEPDDYEALKKLCEGEDINRISICVRRIVKNELRNRGLIK